MERPSVCFVGTHDPAFPRTAVLAEGLRRRGYPVTYCVEPAWGPTSQRVAAARGGLANPALAWRLVRAYVRLGRRLGLQHPAPTVLVGYPGQLDTIVLRALFPRARIILDAFVSLDETLADRAIGSPNGPTRLLARVLDRLAFRLADRVLVDTAAHARRFASAYGLDLRKTVVVPVGAFDPSEAGGNRQQAIGAPQAARTASVGAQFIAPKGAGAMDRAPTDLRVLYFGGFIPLHGVPVILEAARILRPDAGIAFDLIGDGQEADDAERFLAAHPLPHVRFQRCWMAESDLIAEHIPSADVCLGIFAASPKAMDVVPAKIYLALACGKAVVTADTPAVREEILSRGQSSEFKVQSPGIDSELGTQNSELVLVPPADPEALARALLELRDDPALRADVAASGRRLYDVHFRPECVVAPLIAAVEHL